MSRAVIPVAPPCEWDAQMLPSSVTFVVNAGAVHSPQTGAPWYVEMDHQMGHMQMYSLVPQKNNNQYVSHYNIESRMPRFVGKFSFMDAWVTTHHRVFEVGDAEIHSAQVLYHPERADDKIYFDRAPHHRIEIVIPGRFVDDREVLDVLEECQIQPLLQRLP